MSDEPGPLLTLGEKLRSYFPPSLMKLIARLTDRDAYMTFLLLVKDLFPEREAEILANLDEDDRLAAFYNAFSQKYFPLEEAYFLDGEGYEVFDCQMPVTLMGIGFDSYHDIPSDDWRLGPQIMTYVVQSPWEANDSARIPLGEVLLKVHGIPLSQLERIPEGGVSLDEVHRMFDGTEYEGVARWADVLHKNTDNSFLDIDDEDGYVEYPAWNKEEVEYLTGEWQRAESINEIIHSCAGKIENTPLKCFREIANIIDPNSIEAEVDKRQLRLF